MKKNRRLGIGCLFVFFTTQACTYVWYTMKKEKKTIKKAVKKKQLYLYLYLLMYLYKQRKKKKKKKQYGVRYYAYF